MATQGMLSIVQSDQTLLKVVAGSNGMNVHQLKDWLNNNPNWTQESLWEECKSLFGVDSTVLQTSPCDALYEGMFEPPALDEECLYRKHFNNPKFNPRWERGDTEHYIELSI